MKISIIAAVAKNKVIGKENSLPWNLPADLDYFKRKTLGKPIVMGLRTFQSIGGNPLPGRKNIILKNDKNYKTPAECLLAKSIDEVLEITKNEEEIMICGGASVYNQFLPLADNLYLTIIHHVFEGDVFFTDFYINEWQEVERTDNRPDEKNPYSYSFIVFKKK